MKKALVIAATLVSASAFASVNLSVRSDYINQMKNDKAGIDGSSTFVPSYARMNLGGKVGEAEVKASFDFTAATAGGAISASNFVNHLYIKKSFNDGWAMSAGKLVNPTGGFEAEAIDAGNDYNASLANGGSGLGTIATGGTARLNNASGVGAHWMSGSHAVEVQATNDTDGAATNNAPEKAHNYGVAYTGGLTESLWLKVSYFAGFTDTTTPAADSDQTYMGVGVRWAAAPFDLTFDYLANGTKPVGGSEDKTTSMVLNFRYSMDSWTPFAKVEMSEVKPNGSDADKKTGLTIGAEMAHGSDFRYHLAYVMNTFDPAAAGDNQTDSKIIAGIKWDADLLK